MNILNRLHGPGDLQKLSQTDLKQLSCEIRETITKTVSENGGHLASNLGVVELTLALHRVFPLPEDKIVWDVGHQAYTHKMLTGRRDRIGTIRKKGGLSGYPSIKESPFDAFGAGHASTSISAALGIAQAKRLKGEKGHTIAVIGDGALTGGLAYEGLNNAGRFKGNFIVILNDNTMSISRNVGSIAKYLTHIRTRPGYLRLKSHMETAVDRIPLVGKPLRRGISHAKSSVKRLVYTSTLFEDFGFAYYGPLDGHDIKGLMEALESAKTAERPVLLHVITKKGKGYSFAERNPGKYHGVSKFDVKAGVPLSEEDTFSSVTGRCLCDFAERDPHICAITAAMAEGTGLTDFACRFPERFFDVGIAEEHAVTFSAGLAAGGMLPVCTLYSTFLQRGYDQIIHDAALQNLRMVFAVDRAGIVGEDGETHQGIFDASFLNAIPNISVYSPYSYSELREALETALYSSKGVAVVRYPRGKEPFLPKEIKKICKEYWLYGENSASIAIITYGRLFSAACEAVHLLDAEGIKARVIKLNRIKPIAREAVSNICTASKVFFFEEGIENGGIGEHLGSLLLRRHFTGTYFLKGIQGFVPHASMEEALHSLGLDAQGMKKTIEAECKK